MFIKFVVSLAFFFFHCFFPLFSIPFHSIRFQFHCFALRNDWQSFQTVYISFTKPNISVKLPAIRNYKLKLEFIEWSNLHTGQDLHKRNFHQNHHDVDDDEKNITPIDLNEDTNKVKEPMFKQTHFVLCWCISIQWVRFITTTLVCWFVRFSFSLISFCISLFAVSFELFVLTQMVYNI